MAVGNGGCHQPRADGLGPASRSRSFRGGPEAAAAGWSLAPGLATTPGLPACLSAAGHGAQAAAAPAARALDAGGSGQARRRGGGRRRMVSGAGGRRAGRGASR